MKTTLLSLFLLVLFVIEISCAAKSSFNINNVELPESFRVRDKNSVYDGTRYVYFCVQDVYRIDLTTNQSTMVLSRNYCANNYCTSVGVGEGYIFFYSYLGYMQWALGRANADGSGVNSTFVPLKSSILTLKYDIPTSKLYFSCQFGMWSVFADGSELTQVASTSNIWTFALGHPADGSIDVYYNVDQTGILKVNTNTKQVTTAYGCTKVGPAGCFPRGMALDFTEENLFFSASNGYNPYIQIVNVKTGAYVEGLSSPSAAPAACMMITDPYTNTIYVGGSSGLWVMDADLPNVTLSQIYPTNSANRPFACGVALYEATAPITVAAIHPTSGPQTGGNTIYVKGSGFLEVPKISCRFGGVVTVPATFLFDDLVTCVTPVSPVAGQSLVQVSNDGQTWTTQQVFYTYAK